MTDEQNATSQTSEPAAVVAPPTPDPAATVPVVPAPSDPSVPIGANTKAPPTATSVVEEAESVATQAGTDIEVDGENILKSLFASHSNLTQIAEDFAKAEVQALHPFISQGVTNLKAELDKLKALLDKAASL